MTAIVDYKAGNLTSVKYALAALGEDALVTSDPAQIAAAERVVFPGVGAAKSAMANLRALGLDAAVRRAAAEKPFLGICLGMQILFEHSEEDGGVDLLGILPGRVRRFPPAPGCKIPHMGWNDVAASPVVAAASPVVAAASPDAFFSGEALQGTGAAAPAPLQDAPSGAASPVPLAPSGGAGAAAPVSLHSPGASLPRGGAGVAAPVSLHGPDASLPRGGAGGVPPVLCGYFYFVHSYYAEIGPYTAGVTGYAGVEFTSVVRKGNILATQFHPEKSGAAGLALLKGWLSC